MLFGLVCQNVFGTDLFQCTVKPFEVTFGTQKKWFYSYEILNNRTRKMCPFNTGDCLIEVTTWESLTVFLIYCTNQ
jgi:hypothetical protein